MLRNTLILIFSLLLIGSNSYAGSIKENYELQERCGKSSAEFFKKMYGTGYDIKYLKHFYQCHYNKKLNKCFIEIFTTLTGEDGQEKSSDSELHDVHENILYGYFSESTEKMTCIFQGVKCNSRQQWEWLVKPFMKN